jgi:hypothetical protein
MKNLTGEEKHQLNKFRRLFMKLENGYYDYYIREEGNLYAFIKESPRRKNYVYLNEETLKVFTENL